MEEQNQLLIGGEQSYERIEDSISLVVLDPKSHKSNWYITAGIAFLGVNMLLLTLAYLLWMGIGIWGNNQPVGWAFDIINFVWWIGIGHAGTLISAILLLMRQPWRNSINRFAEAMTLFAVMCAGMFPLFHMGRPWVGFYSLFPYPNWLGMWPNFRSPLIWDVFAVSTYFTVSAIFWYYGLIPDFATLRDRAKKLWLARLFGIFAMGWRGAARHWQRYETGYMILAGLSTPLVLSVHSIVSLDFAISIVPGWNVTLFPPYFVAGAIFAGFAMVILLAIPIRKWYGLEDLVTMKHMDWMAKITLATGLIVCYGYFCETFMAYYSGSKWELQLMDNRLHGPYRWVYFALWFCNFLCIQPLWVPAVRRNLKWLFWISMAVTVGMWLERFVIIPMSLYRDYVTSSWHIYTPTVFDFSMFFGTVGFFVFMMWLFVRFVPAINIFEMKDLLYKLKLRQRHDEEHGPGHGPSPAPTPAGGGGGE
jgi:molybdopterin-containing oxidoreductase family membrane subunit